MAPSHNLDEDLSHPSVQSALLPDSEDVAHVAQTTPHLRTIIAPQIP